MANVMNLCHTHQRDYVSTWKLSENVSHSVVSNSLRPHGLSSTRLLCPWDSPGKNTGVGSHFLLQAIVPTQGLYSGLLHRRQSLYRLSHQGICKFKNNMNCFAKYSSTAMKNCQKPILIQNYFQSHELELEEKQGNGHSTLRSY